MYGRICGVSDGVEDRPLAVWPNPFQYKAKYCVADCSYTDASDSAHMAYKYESEQCKSPSHNLQKLSVHQLCFLERTSTIC